MHSLLSDVCALNDYSHFSSYFGILLHLVAVFLLSDHSVSSLVLLFFMIKIIIDFSQHFINKDFLG